MANVPFLLLSIPLLVLAVYRLSRLVIKDTIAEGFREWVWKKFSPETTKIGYLTTCFWCLGLWFSAIMVLLFVLWPIVTFYIALALAISAVVGFLSDKFD